jgi:hypothetical protein
LSGDSLSELIDAKQLRAELGITRAAAERILQSLPIVRFPNLRKTYVKRADVAALIAARTFEKDESPHRGNT